MELYIFRHGQTDWNAKSRIQGHTDIELNEIGRNEAFLLKERLKDLKIEKVFSSDLKRALETARIALEHLDIVTTKDLREANFGEAEGKVFHDVLKEYGEDYFKVERKYWDIRLAGGETKRECLERVWSFINTEVIASGLKRVGISTHGGVIRNVTHSLLEDGAPKVEIPNCCVYKIKLLEDNWVLEGKL